MREDEARILIESLESVQETPVGAIPLPCPRCGGEMDPRKVRNAMSRHARVFICSECGTDEAIRDMVGKPLPLSEWSMARSFE